MVTTVQGKVDLVWLVVLVILAEQQPVNMKRLEP